MLKDKQHIHALWIGNQLTFMELLTIKSFLAHGFKFHLWLYNHPVTEIPKGVIIEDASKIIARHHVFKYKYPNQFGHGKGSYAGFSYIFRYKLLYEYGGWWTDMDVSCLKTPDCKNQYVFGAHNSLSLSAHIMKTPPKSDLMKACYIAAKHKIDATNRDWYLPNKILTEEVEKFGLTNQVKKISPADNWNFIRKMLITSPEISENRYIIHWMNEEWRKNKISKLRVINHSLLSNLLEEYNIYHKKTKSNRTISYLFRTGFPAFLFYYDKSKDD